MNEEQQKTWESWEVVADIAQLASLTTLEYERVREAKAKELGLRASVLDKEVLKARGTGEQDDLQGSAILFPEIEPWPEAVKGADVLDAISQRYSRYVALPTGASDLLTLWCAHT